MRDKGHTYAENKSGPKTEPWGTPIRQVLHGKVVESTYFGNEGDMKVLFFNKKKYKVLFKTNFCNFQHYRAMYPQFH